MNADNSAKTFVEEINLLDQIGTFLERFLDGIREGGNLNIL